MDYVKATRDLCKMAGVTLAELARRTNQSPQNLSKKLKNSTLKFDEYCDYVKVLGGKFEYEITLPGQDMSIASSFKDSASSEIALLQAQNDLERKYNDYLLSIIRDIRTPLATVIGYNDIALRHLRDKAKLLHCLEKVKAACEQMEGLANNAINLRGNGEALRVEDDDNGTMASLVGKRILVVEDNDINRDMTADILSENGIICETACDGKEALTLVSTKDPGYYDAVLMDIHMPVMDGYEATRKIRALPNRIRSNVPVIALSGNALPEDIDASKKAGMDAHLVKPVKSHELFSAISKLI